MFLLTLVSSFGKKRAKTKMKNQKNKKEMNTVLVLLICLIIVGGMSYGLNRFRQSFEISHKVEAESLLPLPDQVKQNQITEIITDGYLSG
jgi:hypothetical protein